MDIKRVSVIGLGKLGACMLAGIASKGVKVIGVDNDAARVKIVNQGHAPLFEPRLEQFFRRYKKKISASTDYYTAVLNSDISFIVVPTPSLANGEFSLSFVAKAAKELGKALAQKQSYHTVVLTSTVLPGTMDNCVKPLLERFSGKKCAKDFGLCYNPEFIALGTVIKNFLNPDFVLIGESDKNSGFLLEKFYRNICENKPAIARMDFINAELTKISVNSFVTTKITFANMLSFMAQKLPGGNVDVVTKALGYDSRIGSRYLKGGLGFGGPCFPRDNSALSAVAGKLGIGATIPKATDKFNRQVILSVFKLIAAKAEKSDSIGILGLSYKPLSNVIE
ncbi:MAG: nucleotide sugar dehydrogenase, partial [Candidatus Omnitrophica bacterium]|nr:nucleotide sugar dehydrogenase [Candidatus Omnitrophota bacterium]